MTTALDTMSPEQRKKKLKEIRSKRARAVRLSTKLAEHEATAAERARLWAELREDGVDVKTLAADSCVTVMAVRKALNSRAAD